MVRKYSSRLRGLFTFLLLAALSFWGMAAQPADSPCCSAKEDTLPAVYRVPRPIISEYNLGVGGMMAKSTYLSPLSYGGWGVRLDGNWSKIFNHWDGKALMSFDGGLGFDRMLNPARTALMYGLTAYFDWGLAWRHDFGRRWTLTAGGEAELYGGVLYLSRNSNNPATALASAGLGITLSGEYRFRLGKLPVSVYDRMKLPSLSLFFSPEYGESYYEIYLGNHQGLLHCGWWGNAFAVENHLQARLHFKKRSLILGWRLTHRSFNANHLKTTLTGNYFTIGMNF